MLDGKVVSKQPSVNTPNVQAPPPPPPQPVEPEEGIVAKAVFNPTAQIGHSPTPVPPAPRGLRDKVINEQFQTINVGLLV